MAAKSLQIFTSSLPLPPSSPLWALVGQEIPEIPLELVESYVDKTKIITKKALPGLESGELILQTLDSLGENIPVKKKRPSKKKWPPKMRKPGKVQSPPKWTPIVARMTTTQIFLFIQFEIEYCLFPTLVQAENGHPLKASHPSFRAPFSTSMIGFGRKSQGSCLGSMLFSGMLELMADSG